MQVSLCSFTRRLSKQILKKENHPANLTGTAQLHVAVLYHSIQLSMTKSSVKAANGALVQGKPQWVQLYPEHPDCWVYFQHG